MSAVALEDEPVHSKMITYDQLAENFHLPINEVCCLLFSVVVVVVVVGGGLMALFFVLFFCC